MPPSMAWALSPALIHICFTHNIILIIHVILGIYDQGLSADAFLPAMRPKAHTSPILPPVTLYMRP